MAKVDVQALRKAGVPDSEILEMYMAAKDSAAKDMTAFLKLRGQVLRRDNMRCVYCGSDGEGKPLHCDHIIPRSRGGKSTLENLACACYRCNCSKNGKPLDEWKRS
jgi:hypothetical protein